MVDTDSQDVVSATVSVLSAGEGSKNQMYFFSKLVIEMNVQVSGQPASLTPGYGIVAAQPKRRLLPKTPHAESHLRGSDQGFLFPAEGTRTLSTAIYL